MYLSPKARGDEHWFLRPLAGLLAYRSVCRNQSKRLEALIGSLSCRFFFLYGIVTEKDARHVSLVFGVRTGWNSPLQREAMKTKMTKLKLAESHSCQGAGGMICGLGGRP